MKPFYGIDRTTLKKNTFHEGERFIAATVSEAARQGYDRAMESGAEQFRQTRLSAPLRWAQGICGWTAALIALGIARALGNVTLAQTYENAPGLYWAFGVCALVWFVLAVMSRRRAKSVTAGENYAQSLRRMEGEADRIRRELGVPENAKEVDVVQLTFRWKDGKLKIHTQGMETTPYTNISMRVYRREDLLCFVNLESRYELPIGAMRRLRRVNKPLIIQDWNKDESIKSDFYKPYKLSLDNYGRIRTKSYGLLELRLDGEDWAVWLPPYELNYISALTGLPITEE